MGIGYSSPEDQTKKWDEYLADTPDWDREDARETFAENLEVVANSMIADFVRDNDEVEFADWIQYGYLYNKTPEEKENLAKAYGTEFAHWLCKQEPDFVKFPLADEFVELVIANRMASAKEYMRC